MTCTEHAQVECHHCDSTGDDDGEWNDRCIFCSGTGYKTITIHDDEDDEHYDERYP